PLVNLGTQARDRSGKFVAPPRGLAEPERYIRRLAARILDPHGPALDPQNAIRSIAKLKNVASQTLDGKILVDASNDVVFGLQQRLVIGGIGNRAARRQCCGPRSASPAQNLMNGIAMNKGATPTTARGEAISQHLHCGVEILTG